MELARDRDEQVPERFAPGEKIDAKVISIDAINRRVALSVKALEIEDEKQAMAEFGSSDSGASLGDILGAAFRQKQAEDQNKGLSGFGAKNGRSATGRGTQVPRPVCLTLRQPFGRVL